MLNNVFGHKKCEATRSVTKIIRIVKGKKLHGMFRPNKKHITARLYT